MKITPLEIRQKTFEKKLRGYDKDEVSAFLLSLSQEWERLNDENKEQKIKLTTSEREVEKLREVENSLFKTLKTAEDTSANMIEQANKTAELHLRETQMTADALLNEAKTKARNMLEEAENDSRRIIDDMERQVYEMHQIYKEIKNHKDSMISDIRYLSKDSLERAEKIDAQSKTLDIEGPMKRINRNTSEVTHSDSTAPEQPTKAKQKEVSEKPQAQKSPEPSEETSSFFDEIE